MKESVVKGLIVLRNLLFVVRCILVVLLLYLCFEAADGYLHNNEFTFTAILFVVCLIAELAIGKEIYEDAKEKGDLQKLVWPEFALFRVADRFEGLGDKIEFFVLIAILIGFFWLVFLFVPLPFLK